jgi:hypothetical protein
MSSDLHTTEKWNLFDAASIVAFYTGTHTDMQNVDTTRDWAPVEGDIDERARVVAGRGDSFSGRGPEATVSLICF